MRPWRYPIKQPSCALIDGASIRHGSIEMPFALSGPERSATESPLLDGAKQGCGGCCFSRLFRTCCWIQKLCTRASIVTAAWTIPIDQLLESWLLLLLLLGPRGPHAHVFFFLDRGNSSVLSGSSSSIQSECEWLTRLGRPDRRLMFTIRKRTCPCEFAKIVQLIISSFAVLGVVHGDIGGRVAFFLRIANGDEWVGTANKKKGVLYQLTLHVWKKSQ